jgi:hypothetical protein
MDETFSFLKEFWPLIAAGGTVVSAVGLVPRIGPGRAIWIALRSRFAFKPNPESFRFAEIKLLRSMIATLSGILSCEQNVKVYLISIR